MNHDAATRRSFAIPILAVLFGVPIATAEIRVAEQGLIVVGIGMLYGYLILVWVGAIWWSLYQSVFVASMFGRLSGMLLVWAPVLLVYSVFAYWLAPWQLAVNLVVGTGLLGLHSVAFARLDRSVSAGPATRRQLRRAASVSTGIVFGVVGLALLVLGETGSGPLYMDLTIALNLMFSGVLTFLGFALAYLLYGLGPQRSGTRLAIYLGAIWLPLSALSLFLWTDAASVYAWIVAGTTAAVGSAVVAIMLRSNTAPGAGA